MTNEACSCPRPGKKNGHPRAGHDGTGPIHSFLGAKLQELGAQRGHQCLTSPAGRCPSSTLSRTASSPSHAIWWRPLQSVPRCLGNSASPWPHPHGSSADSSKASRDAEGVPPAHPPCISTPGRAWSLSCEVKHLKPWPPPCIEQMPPKGKSNRRSDPRLQEPLLASSQLHRLRSPVAACSMGISRSNSIQAYRANASWANVSNHFEIVMRTSPQRLVRELSVANSSETMPRAFSTKLGRTLLKAVSRLLSAAAFGCEQSNASTMAAASVFDSSCVTYICALWRVSAGVGRKVRKARQKRKMGSVVAKICIFFLRILTTFGWFCWGGDGPSA